ncbi:MAG TPA: CBS domain-containing protein [Rhizomicrobium sp.]|jgi:CBS domain-containing protein|nr:CBS domain-containing protein [Rhizomicrobium sp.]
MTIQNILDRKGTKVFTIRPTATVRNAADQMRERGVAALVVESGGAIMGIVSERDIVNAMSRFGEHALSMSVKEILTLAIVTVTPGDSIKRAMSLMTRHRVRQLPVITEGRLAGIVSVGDVVKQRLDDLEAESNVLRDVYIAAH